MLLQVLSAAIKLSRMAKNAIADTTTMSASTSAVILDKFLVPIASEISRPKDVPEGRELSAGII